MKRNDFLLEDLEETIAPADVGDPVINIPALIVLLVFLPGALSIRRFSTVG
ncbi:hypothetical protein [Sorangium sp. So ce388]|uniref:hypothetical protein n=1 Tax=Sorangium sp. So ce388 TaxID=3133309 RepID=UPI003F5B73FB